MTLCELSTGQLDRLAGCCRIPVQQQKIYSNREDSIQIKLQETSLERRPHSSNGDSMGRRILNKNTKELGTGKESNRGSTRKHKKII